MTYREMAAYLRCNSDNKGKCNLDCPYRLKEAIGLDSSLPVDVTIDGVGYCLSCNCDRMLEDVVKKFVEAMVESGENNDCESR